MARPEITTRRLLRWGDLDERRRRAALHAGVLRWIARLGAGAGIAAWAAGEGGVAASRIVVAATVVVYAWVMLGAPFRMYWRPDSPLLARLPIPGRVLFDVALIRSARAALAAAVVVVPAAALVDAPGRHLALVGAVAVASALLLPAIALGGGAIVAGGKAQALMRAVGGAEVAAPPTAWLGVLPGLAAAAVVLAILACAGWLAGTATTTIVGPPAPLLGGLAAASVVAALAARGAAARVMPQAVREVAALDVQRLAHLEIHPPTAIERAIGARLPPGARLVHGKDARLLRRRFPMAFVTGAVTTLALWIVAATRPDAAVVWVGAIVAGFAGYALAMAWRLTARPIELPYLATLPIARADVVRAKAAYLATWTLLYPLLGAAALAARAPVAAAVAAGVAGIVAVSGYVLLRRQLR